MPTPVLWSTAFYSPQPDGYLLVVLHTVSDWRIVRYAEDVVRAHVEGVLGPTVSVEVLEPGMDNTGRPATGQVKILAELDLFNSDPSELRAAVEDGFAEAETAIARRVEIESAEGAPWISRMRSETGE